MAPRPRWIGGVRELADRYRGLVVDQWGVLHDGHTAYPGVRACLEELARRDRPVVVLTNSGRRAAANLDKLESCGLPRELFAGVVSSGEATWRALDPAVWVHGSRCVLLHRGEDRTASRGRGLAFVADPEGADFILLSGCDDDAELAQFEPVLRAAAARDLPLVCANPDVIGLAGTRLTLGPGAVARRYEELGGTVRYLGKPHPEVYRMALELLGDPPPAEVVAVGDSLEHDIAGGARAGLATAFVTGGIHDTEAFAAEGRRDGALDDLARRYGATPDWVLPRFVW
ncbi:MAG TPA: TIGR01459 family HAD-type hydrolase [Geminicoccaceae bacterium]|nr:TIGR01459 family HAD-type hydrolase [Geminicoccaceae bacterium]